MTYRKKIITLAPAPIQATATTPARVLNYWTQHAPALCAASILIGHLWPEHRQMAEDVAILIAALTGGILPPAFLNHAQPVVMEEEEHA